jgi:hypothetical protein
MCETGLLSEGMPDTPCTRDCKLLSQAEDFWEPFGRCQLCCMGYHSVCLGLPCKVLKSIDCRPLTVLTVDYRIKVHMDLQADKSPVVVKGPFIPRVVNPRYRIRGIMCNTRINLVKQGKLSYEEPNCI